jgi:uncharacterized protein
MVSLKLVCNPSHHYTILRYSADADVTETLQLMLHANKSKTNVLFSITKTSSEISIIINDFILDSISPLCIEPNNRENGWISFSIDTTEPIPFDLVGILLSIAKPLAESNIGIFAVSTFNTDHVLIKESNLIKAKQALEVAGHSFVLTTD